MFCKKKKAQCSVQQDASTMKVIYSEQVKKYLTENRKTFMEGWANLCGKTYGRVSYDELYEILGRNFPKAPWNDPNDRNSNIRAFFGELGFPCKADSTHIYFP